MLESQHSLVVKALQRLYKHCINNEGFPGEPLVDVADGHPLTHAILDRLGLIKQAEEGTDEHSESNEEPLQCLRQLSTSTDYTGTVEPSPEPASPRESREFGPEISPTAGDVCKWDLPSMRTEQHSVYPRCDYIGQVQHATTTDRLYQPPIVLSDASRCPDVYYQTDICNASSRPSHLHAGTVPWLGPYQGTVQPSIDTLTINFRWDNSPTLSITLGYPPAGHIQLNTERHSNGKRIHRAFSLVLSQPPPRQVLLLSRENRKVQDAGIGLEHSLPQINDFLSCRLRTLSS